MCKGHLWCVPTVRDLVLSHSVLARFTEGPEMMSGGDGVTWPRESQGALSCVLRSIPEGVSMCGWWYRLGPHACSVCF